MTAITNDPEITKLIEFQNPQRIVFGVGASGKVGEEAKRLGGGKILLISDDNIEKTGILDNILKSIRQNGLDISLHKIPAAEPTMENAREVANASRAQKCDMVIGVGGGSCLDSAKVAALMATNPGDPQEYCVHVGVTPKEVKSKTLPKILIPTTAGTGSEASNTLVIIEKQYKTWITDNRILAETAIIDPTLCRGLPPKTTAGTGMDALSHVVEGLMSAQANPISDSLSTAAAKLVFENLRRAFEHGEDLKARRNMSLAATIGGWVIGFPWVGGPATIGHCISEAVGSRYKIPHGVACAIALPYAMEYNLPLLEEKLASLAAVAGEDTTGLSRRQASFKSIDAVMKLMKHVNLPTSLKEVGVPSIDLKPLAEYIVNERQFLYDLQTFNPTKPTLENVTDLLEKMWEGRIDKK
jgi:alcohol dehydrogenase class IV